MTTTKVPVELSSTPGIVDNSNATAITIDSSENVTIGSVGSGTASATPVELNLGSTFANSAGSLSKAKFKLFEDSSANVYGLSVSSGLMEFGVPSSASYAFFINESEKMRIDSSGNLGLGTTSPTAKKSSTTLQVNGNVAVGDNNATGIVAFGDISSADVNVGIFRGAAGVYSNTNGNSLGLGAYDAVVFTTGNADIASQTERMRIDSSGNVLVGKTSADNTTAGIRLLGSAGFASFVRSGAEPMVVNRLTSDGDLIDFRKDGTTAGNIGTINDLLTIGSGDTGLIFNSGSDAIYPWNITTNAGNDGSIDLGITTRRYKNLYLSSGIYLGGTGAANHLDDYEEGAWTPTIGSGTATYGTSWYVKIGRLVTVHSNVYNPSDSSSGNNVYLSGLPFNSGASSKGSSAGSMVGGQISNGPFYPYIGVNDNKVYFYDQNSGAYHTFAHHDMSSTTDFHFTISYFTDS